MPPHKATVAVCMPAYNASESVRRSIDSILQQTYIDFDFIIVDDCSKDDTIEVIESIDDKRIRLIKNNINRGVAMIRNQMLDHCIEHDYDYMAQMDADDIMYPDRLEKQLDILNGDPSLSACGSSMRIEKDNATWISPPSYDGILAESIFANPIPSSLVTFRVADLRDNELRWNKKFEPCEDYHLWFQFLYLKGLKARSTGDIDGVYMYSPQGASHKDGRLAQERMDAEVKRLILGHLGVSLSCHESFHFMRVGLWRSDSPRDADAFIKVGTALLQATGKMLDKNQIARRLEERATWYLESQKALGFGQRYRLFAAFLPHQNFLRSEIRRKILLAKKMAHSKGE